MDTVLFVFAAVSIAAFVLMGVDKKKARTRQRRIPERVLFIFAIMGGAVGGTLGMYFFRHKTKHWYFAVFFPLLAMAQLIGLYYIL